MEMNRKKQLNLNKIIRSYERHPEGSISFLPSEWIARLFMMILLIADTVIVYEQFTGFQKKSYPIAMVIAGFFVIYPYIVMGINLMENKQMIHTVLGVFLLITFIIIIFLINRDKQFQTETALLLSITSALSMAVSVMDITSERASRLKKYVLNLQNYVKQEELIVKELEEAMKFDFYKENEELYRKAVEEVKAQKKLIIEKVNIMIAEYLEDSNAAVKTFEEN